MQRLGEMLGQVNPFADSYNECIKWDKTYCDAYTHC
jgi:hypothetical protein